jgi:hypothetical protein
MTSPMGGNTAPTNTTNDASGIKGMGTLCIIAHALTNACSATGSGMEKNNVVSCIKGAELDESVTSPTTTPGWPTLTAPQMSGPSNDEKTLTRG